MSAFAVNDEGFIKACLGIIRCRKAANVEFNTATHVQRRHVLHSSIEWMSAHHPEWGLRFFVDDSAIR